MSAIGVLAALATIFAAGFGVLTLLVREPARLHIAEQLALSWLCGTGMITVLLWIGGFVFHGELLFALVALSALGLTAISWKRHGAFRFCPSAPLGGAERVLVLIVVAQALSAAYLSLTYTLGWDGLLNWEIKAHYAFSNGGSLPPAYFHDAGRAFSHPEYPLAIPFSELWLYFWIGEASQFWAKTIFPIFYVCGVTLLIAISCRLTGKLWPGLVAAMVLFFVPQVTVEAGSVIVGYADFPLSVFYLAGVGYLLCAVRNNESDFMRISIISAAFLPWVKREGVILWIIAAVCLALVVWRRKQSPKWLLALLPGLLLAMGWRIYLNQMHAISSSDFVPINLSTIGANFHRIGPIAATFGSEFLDLRAWGIFWVLVPIGAVDVVRKFRDVRTPLLLFAIAAPLISYGLIYVFSAWPDYHRHIGLSLSRLFVHVAPLASLTLPVALAALPSWRALVVPLQISTATKTCAEEFPERTAGIDFA